jgi:hypothetical protein
VFLTTKKVAISRISVGADEHGPAGLKEFVEGADAYRGQLLTVVMNAGARDRAADDVVDVAERQGVVEEALEEFFDAAVGTVTEEQEAEGELVEPGLGDREVEEDRVVVGRRLEGVLESVLSLVALLIDELAADSVFVGEVADGATGQGVEGELLALLGG